MSYDVMKCSVCGTVTETDGNQVCYECWCEADLKQHNLEQKKKKILASYF